MIKKRLKAYRILPNDLYVERKADRQLFSILDEMESPGYVLVARQMGKTNMLLHAKSNYETEVDIFIYIDLSNVFDTSKECFRSIIDKVIENNLAKIGFLGAQIEKKRKSQNIAAHLEHVQELKLILAAIEGKLVIILDEIDALIKTNYSDEIFKQIRSAYFEGRSNYPEFKRLTYFLSGVIDPKQIIKDPRISPFNIGQKIFLDDFTEIETDEFIKRANLELPNSVIERIYYWSKGNPRILYDISAEIESDPSSFHNVDHVDKLVQQLYLTYFDKPPIDHIRELVEFDGELRKSIFAIHDNKSENISIDTRNKLYLAGIVGSEFNKEILNLKNPIISEALNLKWLDELERKKRSLVESALDFYKDADYLRAISFFEEYLQQNALNTWPSGRIFYLAVTYFRLNRYEEAINYFNQVNYDKRGFASGYFEVLFYIGTAYYKLGKFKESIKYFEEVKNEDIDGIYYYPAWSTLGGSYINSNFDENKAVFFKSNEFLIEKLERKLEDTANNEYREQLITPFYNQAVAYNLLNDYGKAIAYFDRALEICKSDLRPHILFEKYKIVENEERKLKILNAIISEIIESNLRPIDQTTSELEFSASMIEKILFESFAKNAFRFFDFLNYVANNNILAENVTPGAMMSVMANIYIKQGNRALGILAYEKIAQQYGDQETQVFIDACRNILLQVDMGLKHQLFSLYDEKMILTKRTLDNYDQQIYAIYISDYISNQNFIRADSIVESVLRRETDQAVEFNTIIFYYYRLCSQNFYAQYEKASQTIDKINVFLNQIVDFKKDSIFVKKDVIKSIIAQIKQTNLLAIDQKNIFYNKLKAYLPNQRVDVKYKNGSVKLYVKFKTIKDDFANDNCTITNTYVV